VRPRFVADCNVGRLGRWLRALGYDASWHPGIADPALVRVALSEGRVLLTRDRDLLQRRAIRSGAVSALFVHDDSVAAQLRQVVTELGLDAGQALTRCLDCNLELEPRLPAQVAKRVPPHVRATQSFYSECPACRRIFWPGTHWSHMHEAFAAASR
jgi:uncharacterized protein with PIN domain